MSETLKTIQILSKVAKIISKIIYIVCIVCGAFCLVSIFTTGIGNGTGEIFKIGGVSVWGIVAKESGESQSEAYMKMIDGFFLFVSYAIIAKLSEKYFKNELAAGTPFTLQGSKEMLRLGIVAVVVPVAARAASEIVFQIIEKVYSVAEKPEILTQSGTGIGIVLIVLSFVLKYGAELNEKNNLHK